MWKKGEAWARAVAKFSFYLIPGQESCTVSVGIMFQFGSF